MIVGRESGRASDVKRIMPSRSSAVGDVFVGTAGEVFVLGWNGWALASEAESQSAELKPTILPVR